MITIKNEIFFIRDVLYPLVCSKFKVLITSKPITLFELIEESLKGDQEDFFFIVSRLKSEGILSESDMEDLYYGILKEATDEFFVGRVKCMYRELPHQTKEEATQEIYNVVRGIREFAKTLDECAELLDYVFPDEKLGIPYRYMFNKKISVDYLKSLIKIEVEGTYDVDYHGFKKEV